jgi:hypothetical protein
MPAYLTVVKGTGKPPARKRGKGDPSPQQLKWLAHGLDQAGGKLPLFDEDGQRISDRTIQSCIGKGWAEPWFDNPIKPDWLICKLTDSGRQAVFRIA